MDNNQKINIDYKKNSVKNLFEYQKILELMIDEVEDYAIYLLDKDGFIKSWNQGAEKIKQYTSEEIIENHFSIFYTEKAKEKNIPANILAEAKLKGRATNSGWRIRKDGSKFWADVTITHIINEETSETIGFTKITRDLTKLKEKEKKLKKKTKDLENANKELEDFSYTVSHDLRAPLRALVGFSNILLEEYGNKLDEEGKRLLTRISKNAVKMSLLINDLLSLSHATRKEIEFQKINTTMLIDTCLDELLDNSDKKIIDIEITELPDIYGDQLMLKQVFQNIIENGIKYSSHVNEPKICISGKKNSSYIEIKIKDNGIGFNMQYADKIFGIFQRLHDSKTYEGTGIGLAIVKKIVDRHNGKISVISEEGIGTEFKISLPILHGGN